MTTKRAFAVFEIKALEPAGGGPRRFKGIASTPSADRMGDIVEPKGAVFKLPLPLLWQHDAGQPIGWVKSAKITDAGIEVEGEVADVPEKGGLKWRLADAWDAIKAGLVRGLSIGFNPLEFAPIDAKNPFGGLRFLSWEWLELSAVTIPANQDANITTIKAFDRNPAALGRMGSRSNTSPGVSGSSGAGDGASSKLQPKGATVKTLEQLRAEREEKAARLAELVEMRKSEQRRFTTDEASEVDELNETLAALDDEIRVKQAEEYQARGARPVDGLTQRGASASRGPTVIVRKQDPDDQFKGQSFVRMVRAKALAHIAGSTPGAIAQHLWGKTNPTLVALIKANEVAGGGSGSGEWGAELVAADTRFTGDFIEFLHASTIYDRLPLRAVPANVAIKGQDGAATGYWVGQSKAIPVSAQDYSTVSLTPLKVAALAVVSNELLRDSTPAAEALVRDALVQASSQRVDATFLSATAASAGVSPAGLLNGLSAGTSAGTDAAGVRADIAALMAGFISDKNVTGLQFVTTPSLALQLQLMRNALGQREFPGARIDGGTLEELPLLTGDNVGTGDLILLKPSDIWKIGDTGVRVEISREATIEQNSAPLGATDTPVSITEKFTSMFQTESTAIKVVRAINYQKRRSGAVAFIDDADYGSTSSA